VDKTASQRLAEDAHAAGVKFHLMIDSRDGFLTGERLRCEIPDWELTDIWFCGPAAFGEAIRHDLLEQHDRPADHFHQELFEMRSAWGSLFLRVITPSSMAQQCNVGYLSTFSRYTNASF